MLKRKLAPLLMENGLEVDAAHGGQALGDSARVRIFPVEFIKGLDQRWREEQLSRTPLGRLASPGDVADAVLAAATTLQSATGCVIPIDGGRPLA